MINLPKVPRSVQIAMINKEFSGKKLKEIKQDKGNIVVFEFEGGGIVIADAYVLALGLPEGKK